ncbi:hypothetical protein D3C73_1088410 [compost metagenome]
MVTDSSVVRAGAQAHLPRDTVNDAGDAQVVVRQVAIELDVDHGEQLGQQVVALDVPGVHPPVLYIAAHLYVHQLALDIVQPHRGDVGLP